MYVLLGYECTSSRREDDQHHLIAMSEIEEDVEKFRDSLLYADATPTDSGVAPFNKYMWEGTPLYLIVIQGPVPAL